MLKKIIVSLVFGFKDKIISLALQYGGQILVDFVKDILKKLKREKEQEAALEKFEEVQKKPDATIDEKGKAYENLINSGR